LNTFLCEKVGKETELWRECAWLEEKKVGRWRSELQHQQTPYKNMCAFLTFLACAGLASVGMYANSSLAPIPSEDVALGGDLTVSKTSSTSVGLSWAPIAGAGNYQVKVIDLTVGQTFGAYSTANTTFSISGLTTGHLYRFSVEKTGYVIAEDVVM
jgi:hypothetical protein